MKVIPETRRVN